MANRVIKYTISNGVIPTHSVYDGEARHPFSDKTSKQSREYIDFFFSSPHGQKDTMPILTRFRTKSVDTSVTVLSPSSSLKTNVWNYVAYVEGDTQVTFRRKEALANKNYTYPDLQTILFFLKTYKDVPWLATPYAGRMLGTGTIYIVTQLNVLDEDIESLVIPSSIPDDILSDEVGSISFVAQLLYALWVLWVNGYVVEVLYFSTVTHTDMTNFRIKANFNDWIEKIKAQGKHIESGFDFSVFQTKAIQSRWSPIVLPMSLFRQRSSDDRFDKYIGSLLSRVGLRTPFTPQTFSQAFSSSLDTGVDSNVGVSLKAHNTDPVISYSDIYCILTFNQELKINVDSGTLFRGTEAIVDLLVQKWVLEFVGHDIIFNYPALINIYHYLILLREFLDHAGFRIQDEYNVWAHRFIQNSTDKLSSQLAKYDSNKMKRAMKALTKYIDNQ